MIVTGYEIRDGEYNNIKYDNVVIYRQLNCTNGKGIKTKSDKIKHKFLDEWMAENMISDYEYLIGMDLDFLYDNFQNVALIKEMVPSKKK